MGQRLVRHLVAVIGADSMLAGCDAASGQLNPEERHPDFERPVLPTGR
jgi:hypothetical protein